MERRKGIPLVALVIFIALLVAIILTCIIILGSNKKPKPATISQQTSQSHEQTPQEVEERIEEELTDEDMINNDSEIRDAYKLTGNNKTFAKYAIYNQGGFDANENNIQNELKLQLAMSQVTNSDMDAQSSKKAVSNDVIAQYVDTIFGDSSDLEYKDFSLYNSDTNFTEQYKTIGYTYKNNSANYEVNENDVDEEEPSEITEVITKVIKYNTKIEIYVKPIFVETMYDYEDERYLRSLYTDYNFSAKQFPIDKSIMTITNDDYKNVLKSNYKQDLDGLNYKEVNQNIDLNQLTEYKYTLTKTETGYNLESFKSNLTTKKNNNKSDEDKELTEQEKAIFNNQFDSYTGTERSGNDVKTLLTAVVTSNKKNKNKTNLIVSITVNGEDAKLEDDDIETLNEKIEELSEDIDEEKSYYVKETYKSGIISSITINEEDE